MKTIKSIILSGALLLSLVVPLAAASSGQQSEGRRGVTPEDYFSFEFLGDPRISPDGKLVAYVVTTVDQKLNRRRSSIWMVATDGSSDPWQFTTSPQSSTSPRWSPDGRSVAFLSSRPVSTEATSEPARNQIYLLSMSGGEARRVTSMKNGVSGFGHPTQEIKTSHEHFSRRHCWSSLAISFFRAMSQRIKWQSGEDRISRIRPGER